MQGQSFVFANSAEDDEDSSAVELEPEKELVADEAPEWRPKFENIFDIYFPNERKIFEVAEAYIHKRNLIGIAGFKKHIAVALNRKKVPLQLSEGMLRKVIGTITHENHKDIIFSTRYVLTASGGFSFNVCIEFKPETLERLIGISKGLSHHFRMIFTITHGRDKVGVMKNSLLRAYLVSDHFIERFYNRCFPEGNSVRFTEKLGIFKDLLIHGNDYADFEIETRVAYNHKTGQFIDAIKVADTIVYCLGSSYPRNSKWSESNMNRVILDASDPRPMQPPALSNAGVLCTCLTSEMIEQGSQDTSLYERLGLTIDTWDKKLDPEKGEVQSYTYRNWKVFTGYKNNVLPVTGPYKLWHE